MISKKANKEQSKAIEHSGGVILSAGAGSGKTFVLVEHLVYLVSEFIKSHNVLKLDTIERESILSDYFSSIVMMTFTNKASEEMRVRLKNRFKDMAESFPDEGWADAFRAIDYLNVGTIHSFCMLLIKQGLIPEVGLDESIESEVKIKAELQAKIRRYVKNRLDQKSILLVGEFLDQIDQITDSFMTIFSDPEIRLNWIAFAEKGVSDQSQILNKLNDVFNFLPSEKLQYEPVMKSGSAKWVGMIEFYLKQRRDLVLTTDLFYKFELITRETSGLKSTKEIQNDPVLTILKSEIDSIKKFHKKNGANLIKYFENLQKFNQVREELIELFLYLNSYWEKNKIGLTFSDLEYLVYKGLMHQSVQAEVSSKFKYFIIDEFQDTSNIQFSIVKKLIGNDFSRLFCVGDPKQAIYGFRGGEIGVFQECLDLMPLSLELKSNYRSEKRIINFCNNFFDEIFKSGRKYKGDDKFAVQVVHQVYPDGKIERDSFVRAYKIKLAQVDDKSIKKAELNLVEAEKIALFIKERLEQDRDEKICILYSKLKSSRYLIAKLMTLNIPFVAQSKITQREMPLLAVSYYLVKSAYDRKNKSLNDSKREIDKNIFLMDKLLEVLGIEGKDPSELVENFIKNRSLFGILNSIILFLKELDLSYQRFAEELSIIGMVESTSKGILGKYLSIVRKESGASDSIQLAFGSNPRVQIMTAHASKGLQFQHVILAGIQSNKGNRNDSELLGSHPDSLKIKIGENYVSSPEYLMEKFFEGEKGYSESKRLFYVACTRAEQYITWFDISVEGEESDLEKELSEDWINALRVTDFRADSTGKLAFNQVDSFVSEEVVDDLIWNKTRLLNLPAFQIDNFGLELNHSSSPNGGIILPELAVTKLSTLSDCAFKFYLKNILKIESEDDFQDFRQLENDVEDAAKLIKSNLKRGTQIHELISEYIKQGFVIPVRVKEAKLIDLLSWVKSRVMTAPETIYISEQSVKFKAHGHYLSGTPDLIAFNRKMNELSVFDFKTGRPNVSRELGYWSQLDLYAYQLFNESQMSENIDHINQVILYVDTLEIKHREMTRTNCEIEIEKLVNRARNLTDYNNQHCTVCDYGNICPYSSAK